MPVWSVSNQKGGVGKTTTALSLAAHSALRGKRCLLIDLDPHGSLTSYAGEDMDLPQKGVYDLFQRKVAGDPLHEQSLVRSTAWKNIDLLASTGALATLDRQIGTRPGMGSVIQEATAQLSKTYDEIYIDCPPMLGILMVNALAAGEQLLLPVQTEFLAIKGMERMLKTVQMVSRSMQIDMPVLIIPTFYDKRTRASKDALQWLKEHVSNQLWERVVPVDTQFREASRKHLPLPLMNPGSRGSLMYGLLLDQLENNNYGTDGQDDGTD